ncbi:MAG TPA: prepilin-type N-terminal cleavage/methylation domain-containing protein, partial [Smithella sp.]|nr:prepilin-type N-terminal cleavage/methylation domain-containing protein [Smithella sp.]
MMRNKHGFTLVELIVALFVGSLVLVAIYSTVNIAQRSSSGLERRVSAQQDARSALELMAAEIRMASFNPLSRDNIWIDVNNFDSDCAGASFVNQNYRGIRQAAANAIAIEMDINGDGSIDDPNEIIRYNYDSANRYITRSTNCGGAQAFLGDTNANQNIKTVLVENNNAGIPVFRYFDGSGADISANVVANPADPLIGIP